MILIFKAINILDLIYNIDNEFGIRPVAVIQDCFQNKPCGSVRGEKLSLKSLIFYPGHSRFFCENFSLVLERIAHPSVMYDFLLDMIFFFVVVKECEEKGIGKKRKNTFGEKWHTRKQLIAI